MINLNEALKIGRIGNNPFDFFQIVDKVTDEAIEEVYDDTKSYIENLDAVAIRHHQKLWNLILEKGRDNNV